MSPESLASSSSSRRAYSSFGSTKVRAVHFLLMEEVRTCTILRVNGGGGL